MQTLVHLWKSVRNNLHCNGISQFLSCNLFVLRPDAGQNINIQIGNKFFETAKQFKYLETTLINQNSIHEEIKSRLKSGNLWYHLVQSLLSSSLLFKNVKIEVCRTVILPVVLCGCETWSLTLREECRLRVSKNRVLRRIFGFKWDEVTGEWRRLHNKELYTVYS